MQSVLVRIKMVLSVCVYIYISIGKTLPSLLMNFNFSILIAENFCYAFFQGAAFNRMWNASSKGSEGSLLTKAKWLTKYDFESKRNNKQGF